MEPAARDGVAGSGTTRQSSGYGVTQPQAGEERRHGFSVQKWPDGSRYEGEFLDSLKHGKGKYTWKNGEVTKLCVR